MARRRWHTWIDYERFQQLAAGSEAFGATDYMLPTPEWALWGSGEAGFSPADTRFKKERRHHKGEAGHAQAAASVGA
jgi:tRNA wybutosine-synthesizing protein 1